MQLNLPVLSFTLLACALSGILFGCAPATAGRFRSKMNDALKEGSRSTGRRTAPAAASTDLVVEFALALTLLAGGGLAIHSLFKLANVDLGFRSDRLLTFYLPVPDGRLTGNEQVNTFYQQLIERVQAVPGINSVSVSTGMPVDGTSFDMPWSTSPASRRRIRASVPAPASTWCRRTITRRSAST